MFLAHSLAQLRCNMLPVLPVSGAISLQRKD